MAIVTITVVPWTRATVGMWNPKRRTSSSPACGPAPVTTVPVNTASDVPAASGERDRAGGRRDGVAALDAVGLAGAAHEHGRVGDEHHRQQEVTLHGDRVQVDEHGDAAEHDLADDAGDQPDRPPA